MTLLSPVDLGPRRAPNRVLFGPHVTNLGRGRAYSDRHIAYYRRRAEGGCGILVLEEASVHESDWPYERAPLASRARDGWARIAAACRPHGPLVLAALGHAGMQGTSAYSQRELWAPSPVAEPATREMPKEMETDDIATVIAGFAAAAAVAVDAGLDGVEVNAGQHSLVRQFLSGLTNLRSDEWGADRLRFGREVLGAVRGALGDRHVLGLRLSCDELAPWAGITPDAAAAIAAELAPLCDYLVVVRGSIFSVPATRPDMQEAPGFNIDLCRSIREGVPVPVVLQGSVVDAGQAEWAIGDGVCHAVEMTRAQIADPDLVVKVAAGDAHRVRPCVLCNQLCQVRDGRNPIVSCIGEPASGHETTDLPETGTAVRPCDVLVVGGGPAGLETARVAARRGHRVRLVECSERLGGAVRTAALGSGRGRLTALVDWLEAECRAAGVEIVTGTAAQTAPIPRPGEVVVDGTGSVPGTRDYDVADGARVVDVVDALVAPPEGTVVVWDPIGGPVAVSLCELLGDRAVLVTVDPIAGNELSRTGDLVGANARLQQKGVRIERRAVLVRVEPGRVRLRHRWTGEETTVACDVVVDAGFRLPAAGVPGAHRRAGDRVAPRTIHEAVLEGRRVALELG